MKQLTILLSICALLLSISCKRAPDDDDFPPINPNYYGQTEYNKLLDTVIQTKMASNKIPGLAVAVIRNKRVDWMQGYGYTNLAEQDSVDKRSLFMLAELAMPFTVSSVMQRVEAQSIDLDIDVSEYIGFEVRNPNYQTTPITLRQLLSHTASLKDVAPIINSTYVSGDADTGLEEFLQSYLVPGGTYYSGNNFKADKPGKTREVCGVGIALAALAVEKVSGVNFGEYCRPHIFADIGAYDLSWFIKDLSNKTIATPYSNSPNPLFALEQYGYPTYPSGQLRMGLEHLSRFWLAMMTDGSYNQQQIVSDSTLSLMKTVPFPLANADQAFGWYYRTIAGRDLLGIEGKDQGVSNLMYYDVNTDIGVIVLSNGDNYDAALKDIMNLTFDIAELF